jgi:hypothetical protein
MMSDLQAEIYRTHIKMMVLSSKQYREELEEFLLTVVNEFESTEPIVQQLMIEVLDEAAQEAFRMREVYDTALIKMKHIKENAGE